MEAEDTGFILLNGRGQLGEKFDDLRKMKISNFVYFDCSKLRKYYPVELAVLGRERGDNVALLRERSGGHCGGGVAKLLKLEIDDSA